ncbi:MAG TPA: hypothetical protein VG406_11230 [Isosphaeraceae bacterium]|jgi:hypothetical protein|nr:hypothetical protein [Isosphaeraceae bacterium]
MSREYPKLPIIPSTSPPAPAAKVDKYGSLRYLALGGLMVLVTLVGYFGYGVWSMREVWSRVYVVNDPRRPESERIEAAEALARDPRVSQRQRWDLALSRTPPPLARYLLAEGLTAEAVSADPRGYAMAVARSEGWPDWLRLLLLRPLAYWASDHPGEHTLPRESLVELTRHADPILALWARFTLAASEGDRNAADAIRDESRRDGPRRELAGMLATALPGQVQGSTPAFRRRALDMATTWLRDHHPEAVALFDGRPRAR